MVATATKLLHHVNIIVALSLSFRPLLLQAADRCCSDIHRYVCARDLAPDNGTEADLGRKKLTDYEAHMWLTGHHMDWQN